MTTATKNLVAVTPGGEITSDMLAGFYFWYSLPQQMIPLPRARRALREARLDERVLPDERRGEHVMQEACKSVERVTSNGSREEIHADQVMRDGDFLIYQVTRHVQDKAHRVIEHPKALRVLYGFHTGELSFEPLDGSRMADVQGLADEIQGHFDNNAAKMSSHHFRTILRQYVEEAGAESMRGRSGGVYFIAKRNALAGYNRLRDHHGDTIDGEWFVNAVREALKIVFGQDAEFHIIPCINDEGQRAFLKRKFIENCAEDLKRYRDECLSLVRGKEDRQRSVRADKRARMVEERKEMSMRREKFAAILGETMEELDRDMGLADKALARFLTEADA